MNKFIFATMASCSIAFALSSCATIIGGAKYNARIQVPSHPNANITVNGDYVGRGEANIKLKRKKADELSITVEEENCKPETVNFRNKTFRGWSLVGTLGFTGVLVPPGIPFPLGVVVDACTGAWWKPDEHDNGVKKIDYDYFVYTVNYKGVPIDDSAIKPKEMQPSNDTSSKAEKLRELKQLFDEGVLTKEEYETEKAKILNPNN